MFLNNINTVNSFLMRVSVYTYPFSLVWLDQQSFIRLNQGLLMVLHSLYRGNLESNLRSANQLTYSLEHTPSHGLL